MSAVTTIVVILIAFTIGYKVIGWFFDRLRGSQPPVASNAHTSLDPGPHDAGYARTADAIRVGGERGQSRTQAYEDPETRYAKVLGLSRNFTGPEIKERFRTLMASYHPDKFGDLGPEPREMADRKTRELIEAYEYFRVKYNLK